MAVGAFSALAAGLGALLVKRNPKIQASGSSVGPDRKISTEDALTPIEQAILTSFVDLLIPRDETPGAVDLGIHRILLERAGQSERFRADAKKICNSLTRHAAKWGGSDFPNLAEERRASLIATLERAPTDSFEKRFFDAMRQFVFHWYYADPRSWEQLCYQGPPQPRGYPEYRDRPARCGRS